MLPAVNCYVKHMSESNLKAIFNNSISCFQPFLVTGELTNESDVKNIMEKTLERYGHLDVLVNNAGILELGGIEQVTLEQMDLLYRINVRYVSFEADAIILPTSFCAIHFSLQGTTGYFLFVT